MAVYDSEAQRRLQENIDELQSELDSLENMVKEIERKLDELLSQTKTARGGA